MVWRGDILLSLAHTIPMDHCGNQQGEGGLQVWLAAILLSLGLSILGDEPLGEVTRVCKRFGPHGSTSGKS